jgi:hypothetical protein
MSLLPLYEGEVLMPEIGARMTAHNFDLWDLEPSFRDPTNGRLLQVDGIFTRSSSDLLSPTTEHPNANPPQNNP